MLALVGLLAAKFFGYFALFAVAPPLLKFAPAMRMQFALRWAAVRLGTGLVAIVPAYALLWAGGKGSALGAAFYVGIYVIRGLIWAGIAKEISRRHQPAKPARWVGWVGLGLLINFAFDMLIAGTAVGALKLIC